MICSRPDCNQDHRSRQTGKGKKSLACHFCKFMFYMICGGDQKT
nr:MAG TPA: IBR domain, a half RING-finger domain [Bacteriophage sp.]